jgi:transposase
VGAAAEVTRVREPALRGPPQPRRRDAPITGSREALVPTTHCSRHLDAKLDLGFGRAWVRTLDAERGRPALAPVGFVTLQRSMCFAGLRSERQLMAVVADRLSRRWSLGYALAEALPDHSSLSRIRQRLGVESFQRFCERIVDRCQEAGLVWGRELSFAATKVEANAGIPSLVPRFSDAATTHVADRFADGLAAEEATPAPPDDDLPEGSVRLPIRPERVLPATDPPGRLLEARRLDPGRPAHRGYQRTRNFRVSPTDPDAAPRWDWGAIRRGYHDH